MPTPGRQRSRPAQPAQPERKTLTFTQEKLNRIIKSRVAETHAKYTATAELAAVLREALADAVVRIHDLEDQLGVEVDSETTVLSLQAVAAARLATSTNGTPT